MKIIRHIVLILMFSHLGKEVLSQQINLNQNTHFNLFDENIAFAGNYEATHFTANYFQLWNIEGAPTSFNFSAHTPIQKNKLGVGIHASRTTIGAHEEVLFKTALSYKIPLKNGRIAFGMAAGFTQYNFKTNQLNPLDPNDQLLGFSGLNSSVINVDAAALYTDNKNFLGIEVNHLLKSEWNLTESDSSLHIPHFKAIAGHVFPLKNDDFVRVSAHVRTDQNLSIQSDIMASYFYNSKIWFGAGYRLDYGLLATLEINFTKRLHAGYLASIPFNNSTDFFTPSHSVFIGYMLPREKSNAPSLRSF